MLTKMFDQDLSDKRHAPSLDWLTTEARDAFQQAEQGDRDTALGRLCVIVTDLIHYGESMRGQNGR